MLRGVRLLVLAALACAAVLDLSWHTAPHARWTTWPAALAADDVGGSGDAGEVTGADDGSDTPAPSGVIGSVCGDGVRELRGQQLHLLDALHAIDDFDPRSTAGEAGFARLAEVVNSQKSMETGVGLWDDGARLAEAGDWDEAASRFSQLMNLGLRPPAVLCAAGETLLRAGRFREARVRWAELLEAWPDALHARVHARLARIHDAQGETDDAVTAYHAALAADPDSAEAHVGLAMVLSSTWPLQTDAVEAAEAHFREAIRLQPDNADARVELSQLLASAGRWGQSLVSLLSEATDLAPDPSPRVLHLLARAQLVAGVARRDAAAVAAATHAYERASEASPGDAAVRHECVTLRGGAWRDAPSPRAVACAAPDRRCVLVCACAWTPRTPQVWSRAGGGPRCTPRRGAAAQGR